MRCNEYTSAQVCLFEYRLKKSVAELGWMKTRESKIENLLHHDKNIEMYDKQNCFLAN